MASAIEIAAGVRSGALKAVDVVERHLAAIAVREPEIHAFNLVMADQARANAESVDAIVAAGGDPGPLAGVPIALKDNMCTHGVPTTSAEMRSDTDVDARGHSPSSPRPIAQTSVCIPPGRA